MLGGFTAHGDDAGRADLAAQAGHRGGDGGRVVGEIVVHRDAAHHATHFHAPLDVLEAGERIQALQERHADMAGGEQGSAGIGPVVLAGEFPGATADQAVRSVEGQFAARIVAGDAITRRVVEAFDRRPAAALQNTLKTGFGGVRDDQAGLRQGADKMVELRFDGGKIGEDA